MPSILSRLGSFFERKASATAGSVSLWNLGQPTWTPRKYDALAHEGFERCAVVYRCVSLISRCVAAVPIEAWRNDKQIEDHNHPVLKLLKRPNPGQAWASFAESAMGYYLLSGNTYLEGIGPEGRQTLPREIYTLRPDRMQVIPGRYGVEGYRHEVNGVPTTFRNDPITGRGPILHLKMFHPRNDWYGLSPLEAAAIAVDQHNAAMAWNVSLLQNGARPPGALVAKGNMTSDQRDSLRQQFSEGHTSPGKVGRPLVLEGEMTWQEMGITPRDMDWLQGRHASARDIAMAYGTPSQLVGVPGDATFANYEQARLALYEETCLPLLNALCSELSVWFGEGIELRPDLDAIPAMVERRLAAWDKVERSTFLTINEKREALGYARRPEPEADELYLPAGMAPISMAAEDLPGDEDPAGA